MLLHIALVACLIPGTGGVSPAAAQSARGLFGGQSTSHSAEIFLTVAEGYDSDTPEGLRTVFDPAGLQADGLSTSLDISGKYAWEGSRFQVAANGASGWRYFNERRDFRALTHTAGIGARAGLWRGASIAANQTVAYSPSYLYALFPAATPAELGSAIPAGPNYSVRSLESLTYGTSLTFTQPLGRRRTGSVLADLSVTDFHNPEQGRQDLRSRGVAGELRQPLSRNTAMTFAYRYRDGDFGFIQGARATEHGLDVGWSYSRPLSLSRRAVFGIAIGGSTMNLSGASGPVSTTSDIRLLRSEATAGYQFRRTWTARGAYRRAFEYVPEFADPVAVDGFSALLQGLLSRRTELHVAAGYSSGKSALQRNNLMFDTYTGNIRVRYRVTSLLALYGEYLYYYYDFREQSALAPGLPRSLERSAVRAGLTLWLPLLGR